MEKCTLRPHWDTIFFPTNRQKLWRLEIPRFRGYKSRELWISLQWWKCKLVQIFCISLVFLESWIYIITLESVNFCKGTGSKFLGFGAYQIFFTTTELCYCRVHRQSSHRQYINEHGCVPIKFYLQKTATGPFWAIVCWPLIRLTSSHIGIHALEKLSHVSWELYLNAYQCVIDQPKKKKKHHGKIQMLI